MSHVTPTFSMSNYDKSNDAVDNGVYLHFEGGAFRIRVADDKEGFSEFIKHLQKVEKEIYEYY